MRKEFWPLIFATLIGILLTGSVRAEAVGVAITPVLIPSPGGTTTITVASNRTSIGFIKVIQPNGEYSIIGIRLPSEEGSVSKDYPDDFKSPSYECPYVECLNGDATTSSLGEVQRARETLLLQIQALLEQQRSMHPGSTQQLGEYRVEVSLLGGISYERFWVQPFSVVPESFLGPLMATAASFIALAVFLKLKLFRTKDRLR